MRGLAPASLQILLAMTAVVAHAADQQESTIKDYLVDIGAGHVAANEIIGLSGSAVTNLQTPKDLIAAISALGDSSSKTGFGIAWSPGRSGAPLLGVSARKYAVDDGRSLHRLWGSTTFSYAQNTNSIGGADYAQTAVAINVAYYLRAKEDPVVVGYQSFGGGDKGKCNDQSEAFRAAAEGLTSSVNARMIQRHKELNLRPDEALPKAEVDQIKSEFSSDAQARLPALAKDMRKRRDATSEPTERARLDKALAELSQCAIDASQKASDKWNASHLDLVVGQGWIRPTAGGSDRLSLGRHLALALAYSTDGLPDSLFNLTLRRVDRELDLDTLTSTPTFNKSTLAAFRYTHHMGAGHSTYALGEVSNAKSSKSTTANAVFKWALGIDHQLRAGTWIEFRVGRSRAPGSTTDENKALLSLKLSPEATLPNAGKGD